jgi:hypothetical protein
VESEKAAKEIQVLSKEWMRIMRCLISDDFVGVNFHAPLLPIRKYFGRKIPNDSTSNAPPLRAPMVALL